MKTVDVPEHLRRCLARRVPVPIELRDATRCAVLVPVTARGDGYAVVYTLRSRQLPSHGGQVAFPGGKHSPESDSSLLATALREANEEIGVEPAEVDVLGRLDDVATVAGDFVITPFVGVVPSAYRYRPCPSEVEEVFCVDLDRLADPAHHGVQSREWRGRSYEVEAISAGGKTIWGATHRITLDLLARFND